MGRDVRITSTMHARVIGLVKDEEEFNDMIDSILREALDARSARRLGEKDLNKRLADLYRDLLYTLNRMPSGGEPTSIFARQNILFSRIASEIGELITLLDIYSTRYQEPVFDVTMAARVIEQPPGADMNDLVEEVRHLTEAVEAGISVSIEKE